MWKGGPDREFKGHDRLDQVDPGNVEMSSKKLYFNGRHACIVLERPAPQNAKTRRLGESGGPKGPYGRPKTHHEYS